MKRLFVLSVVLGTGLLFGSCRLWEAQPKMHYGTNIITEPEDNEEYELIILDPGFDSWFATHQQPTNFHSVEYYESQNRIYVSRWNEKVDMQAFYHSSDHPFENKIGYDLSIHYGLELNYKLYYYFKYIESIYGARYDFRV